MCIGFNACQQLYGQKGVNLYLGINIMLQIFLGYKSMKLHLSITSSVLICKIVLNIYDPSSYGVCVPLKGREKVISIFVTYFNFNSKLERFYICYVMECT